MSARPAPTLHDIRTKRREILRILASRGARNARVFGSVARGDAVAESDVDLLVDFDGTLPNGFRYFGMISDLQDELAGVLGRPVHVIRAAGLSRGARRILNEAVPL
ncbi:MAG TPA: nucleotidyltransferase domain-containing protein [Candidatus Dormibacteraeota bacterium]|nr:nucleotidyltransferase domain-containing protein [Candidatus Dormibacteraeota bacterium]